MAKLRVAILFGGKSAEHEVSLRSARSVVEAIDKTKYEVVLIALDKKGHWLPPRKSAALLKEASIPATEKSIALRPGEDGMITSEEEPAAGRIDVVFPVLHGPFGEDGTIQGLLRLANVAFVGPGVLGSAVGMDKDVMKRLLREAGIPIAKIVTMTKRDALPFAQAKKMLGLPLFVKPANLGSSVGISKVRDEREYEAALTEAFKYDIKIVVEEFIRGREIECAVLGNEEPKASVPGEVKVHHDFYSYEAKYLDDNGASLEIPAKLPKKTASRVQDLAVKTFVTLGCEGMGRVDSFVADDGEVFVNEINTIPGFTSISMYPKLWEASGLPYTKLIDTLLELALARHRRDQNLQTAR